MESSVQSEMTHPSPGPSNPSNVERMLPTQAWLLVPPQIIAKVRHLNILSHNAELQSVITSDRTIRINAAAEWQDLKIEPHSRNAGTTTTSGH